jgi:hypothetical protein
MKLRHFLHLATGAVVNKPDVALDFRRKRNMNDGHGRLSLTGSLLSPRQRRVASAGFGWCGSAVSSGDT